MLKMVKLKSWEGEGLTGKWLATLKVDGVCTIVEEGKAVSKRGKPLYNHEYVLPLLEDGIYETFRTDWNTSVSLVRTKNGEEKVSLGDMYRVDIMKDEGPLVYFEIYEATNEERFLGPKVLEDPSGYTIAALLKKVIGLGYEGLVLVPVNADGRPNWKAPRYKVKPDVTVDIKVTGWKEGTGKYVGMLGAFCTPYGDVGTGFTDDQRREFWEDKEQFLNEIIEVKAMGWTKGGKLRHPRFIRKRWDKNVENLEGYDKEQVL